MTTGVYIRARRRDGAWDSLDIGDPELSDEQVLEWLTKKNVNPFGIRLVGILLDRPVLRATP